MACTAARYGTQRCILLAANTLDTLCCPQKERKLQQCNRFLCIYTGGNTAENDTEQVLFKLQRLKVHRQIDAHIAHRLLDERRLRQHQLLVGLKIFRCTVSIRLHIAS